MSKRQIIRKAAERKREESPYLRYFFEFESSAGWIRMLRVSKTYSYDIYTETSSGEFKYHSNLKDTGSYEKWIRRNHE